MADTNLAEVVGQIKEFWSPVFDTELRTKQIMATIIDASDKLMPGSIISEGNKVYVSQVNKTVGVNQASTVKTYTTEALSTQRIAVTIDQRAYAGLEFVDVVELQSQINLNRMDVRDAMMYGMNSQINNYLYSLVAPTVEQTAVATIDAQKLTEIAALADDAGWAEDDRWLIVDPLYKKQLMDDATLTSADFGATDRPVIGGQMVLERYGWKIIMDNSAQFKVQVNGAAAGVAMFFTSNWAHYVPQVSSRFKASDAHSNNEFSIKATVDTIYGAALGNDGADKHIVVRTGS
jgi:hypothetical protein